MKKIILLSFFSLPAFASGGNSLSLLWLETGLFFLVIISLFVKKLTLKKQAIVLGGYIISAVVVLFVISGIPYSANLVFINSVSIMLPAFVWVALMLIVTKK